MKTGLMVLVLLSLLVGFVSAGSRSKPPEAASDEWGILFTGEQDGDTALYWMRPDGSDLEQAFNLSDLSTNLLVRPIGVLSPDGQNLALTFSDVTSAYKRFTLLNRETLSASRLTREDISSKQFYWSPDGKRVAYVTDLWGSRLYLIDLETGEETLLALASDVSSTNKTAYFLSLDWSPDGETLGVTYLREERLLAPDDVTVLLMNTQTGLTERILDPDHWGFAATWDGTDRMYYVCHTPARLMLRLCAVDVARRLSVPIRDFTTALPSGGYISHLDVAPDGRILFSFSDGSGRDLMYLFDLEQRQLTNLTELTGMRGTLPTWFSRSQALDRSK